MSGDKRATEGQYAPGAGSESSNDWKQPAPKLPKTGKCPLCFGQEYEVRVEDEDGTIDDWFRARYMTANARACGWVWEIIDPRFTRDEVQIVNWRRIQNKVI